MTLYLAIDLINCIYEFEMSIADIVGYGLFSEANFYGTSKDG
jgi:hypothetical protein